MLRDGFYKVDFAASLPSAGGVVVLDGGVIRGGDDQMIYSGSYGVSGSDPNANMTMTGEISVRAHVNGANSVFNTGSQPFTLKLSGTTDGTSFRLGGPSPAGGPHRNRRYVHRSAGVLGQSVATQYDDAAFGRFCFYTPADWSTVSSRVGTAAAIDQPAARQWPKL